MPITITGKKPLDIDSTTVTDLRTVLRIVDPVPGGSGTAIKDPSIINVSGIDTDLTFKLLANTWIELMFFEVTVGSPLIKVGTILGGEDIIPQMLIEGFSLQRPEKKISVDTDIYINISGGGVKIRTDIKSSLFIDSMIPAYTLVNAYTKAEVDTELAKKADKTDVLRLSGLTRILLPASKADIDSIVFKILYCETYHIGDVTPSNRHFTVPFPSPVANINYMVLPTIVAIGTPNPLDAMFAYAVAEAEKTVNGFGIYISELVGKTQDINLEYLIVQKP